MGKGKPWGNLGFYYDASGSHDDNLIPLGTVESGMDQLDRLQQGQVTVDLVQQPAIRRCGPRGGH